MMERFEELMSVAEKRPKTDQEIIDQIILHMKNAKEAMSQPARVGNTNTALYLMEGLEARAAHNGDDSSLKALEVRMEEAFGPREDKTDAK